MIDNWCTITEDMPRRSLPKDNEGVLIWRDNDGIDIAYTDKGFWYVIGTNGADDLAISTPQVWQCLPDSPEKMMHDEMLEEWSPKSYDFL